MRLKRMRSPLALAACTTLIIGISAASASALSYAGCGSSSVIEVLYTQNGTDAFECFSGTGSLNLNIPNVIWIKAGQYRTWAVVHVPSGYYTADISPYTVSTVGNGTLLSLDAT